MSRTTYQQWYANLRIPWLVGGPNGQAESATWPAVLDAQTVTLDAARKVAYPDYAPLDALAHLGGDRLLIQGSNESVANFQTRLKTIWDDANRLGTWVELLVQLYWFGLSGAVIVQQNGYSYTLSGAPTAGQDPTSLLTVTPTTTLLNTLTCSLNPQRQIPSGNPWFWFDANTDLCNRFAVIVPSWPFSSLAYAAFVNSDTATFTWPIPFSANQSILLMYGPPYGSNITLTCDGTLLTNLGGTLRASAPWTGIVPVIGWPFGSTVNPFNTFSSVNLGQLQTIISTWRPNATCVGVYTTYGLGQMWDWPTGRTWDGGSRTSWDTSVDWAQILGSF